MIRVLTPLPGCGYAEYAWDSLTSTMRRALVGAQAVPGSPVRGHIRTLLALVRRDLIAVDSTDGQYYITERGMALVKWAKEMERV